MWVVDKTIRIEENIITSSSKLQMEKKRFDEKLATTTFQKYLEC